MSVHVPTRRLGELADSVGDLLIRLDGDPATPLTGLAYDVRSVAPGDLFFCTVRGPDAHDFAGLTVAAGAAALCVERPTGSGVPELLVTDTQLAMAKIAAAFYGRPADGLRLLAVTGTNGKTTTTYLLEAILESAGRRPGVIGSVEARIAGRPQPSPGTTPEAPDLHQFLAAMRDAAVDTVIVEVSSQAMAFDRVHGLRFVAAAFTNLAPDHLDFHGTVERYFAAKRSLFVPERTERAAINVDDAYGRELLAVTALPVLRFGSAVDAEVRAEDVALTSAGSTFRLVTPARTVPVHTPLVGWFNISNCLAAAATALQAGIEPEAIAMGLARVSAVPGRFERIDEGQPFAVVVDFARTPEALDQALRAARLIASDDGRVVCVFGSSSESGREARHRMGVVAGSQADGVVITLDSPGFEDPRTIVEHIAQGLASQLPRDGYEVVLDRHKAIAGAIASAHAGDVVVVEGRGIEPFRNILGRDFPFDDRTVTRNALRAAGWPKRGG